MENWSPFGAAGENHERDDAYAFVGSSSLQVRDLTVPGMDVFTPSLAFSDHAAVEEGMVDAHVRWRDRDFLSMYVRFVDEDDHYLVAAGYPHRGEDAVGLYRTVDGTTELVDSLSISSLSNGASVAATAGSWVPVRVTWRVTPAGAFEVRAFEDASADGWRALGVGGGSATATTDANGSWSALLANGTYDVTASSGGLSTSKTIAHDAATPVTLVLAEPDSNQSVALVESVDAPAAVGANESFQVSATVRNAGNASGVVAPSQAAKSVTPRDQGCGTPVVRAFAACRPKGMLPLVRYSAGMLVESVMTTPVETIDADASMMTVLDEMLDRAVGSLVVTTGSPPRKAGIVTDSDVKEALHDFEHPLEDATFVDRIVFQLRRPVTGAPVREYMSAPLVTVEPETTLSNAIATMNDHEIKHLVVTKQMELEGILTASDVGRVHNAVVNEARRSDAHRPHWER